MKASGTMKTAKTGHICSQGKCVPALPTQSAHFLPTQTLISSNRFGARIAERQIQTCGVADVVNEVRKSGSDIFEGLKVADLHLLDLQRLEGAFGLNLVEWAAATDH